MGKYLTGKRHSRNAIAVRKLTKMFEVEKDAKNQAYFFILSHGHFDEFREFCLSYRSEDSHRDCMEYILKNI